MLQSSLQFSDFNSKWVYPGAGTSKIIDPLARHRIFDAILERIEDKYGLYVRKDNDSYIVNDKFILDAKMEPEGVFFMKDGNVHSILMINTDIIGQCRERIDDAVHEAIKKSSWNRVWKLKFKGDLYVVDQVDGDKKRRLHFGDIDPMIFNSREEAQVISDRYPQYRLTII